MGFEWKRIAVGALACVLAGPASAGDEAGTPEQAEAMVKQAIAFLNQEGLEKTLKEVSRSDGPFVSGAIYVTVNSMEGRIVAHPINTRLIGRNMVNLHDVDGRYLYKERIELAHRQASFWQDYKFVNPLTRKIEPKRTYCERAQELIFCAGAYKKP
jgi:cytochrome c